MFNELVQAYKTVIGDRIEIYDKEEGENKLKSCDKKDDYGRPILNVLKHPYMHRFLPVNEIDINKEDFIFQIFDMNAGDEAQNVGELKYCVNLFGLTANGQSVHVNVRNFKPYFYVKVPSFFTRFHVNFLFKAIQNKIKYIDAEKVDEIVSAKLVKKKEFFGFTNQKKFKFVCFHFMNIDTMRLVKRFFYNEIQDRNISPEPIKYYLYESDIEPHIRFIHLSNINPCGWISLKAGTYEQITGGMAPTTCQYDFRISWKNVSKYQDGHTEETIAPIIQASFDIECVSETGAFPEAINANDNVIQIGTTVYIRGFDNEEMALKHIITLNSSSELAGIYTESYNDEKSVLLAWTRFITWLDPDIIIGYNINGFDYKYLYNRAKFYNIEKRFAKLGRYRNRPCKYIDGKELKSAALGDNKLYFYETTGRVGIDIMKYIQSVFKFESYSLNAVSSEFFNEKISNVTYDEIRNVTVITTKITPIIKEGNYVSFLVNEFLYVTGDIYKFEIKKIIKETNEFIIDKNIELQNEDGDIKWTLVKDDVPPNKIFEYQNIDAKHRSKIAKYCIMDCILCNKLLDKLVIIANSVGMSNICYIPMSYLFVRGQGVKVYSLVAKWCRLEDFIIKELKKDKVLENEEKYKGATVLSAVPGAHFYPVVCNDFSALYPSSMISHNLSHDTFIPKNSKYYDMEGIKYHDIEWEVDGVKKSYRYVIPEDLSISKEKYNELKQTEEGRKQINQLESERKGRGIIPRILIMLLAARKAVKARMKKESDPFKKSILNGLQLAYKVTCNSVYGHLGSSNGQVRMKELAETTTAVGRQLLMFARDTAIKHFPGSKCVYGDSVVGNTAVIIRQNGVVHILQIDELNTFIKCDWEDYHGGKKQVNLFNRDDINLEVWSDKGFTRINRIIKHKTHKRLFIVMTYTGIVECTEDHSLITENDKKIKPQNVQKNTKLLHNRPDFDDKLNDCDFKDYDKTINECKGILIPLDDNRCSKVNLTHFLYYLTKKGYHFYFKSNYESSVCIKWNKGRVASPTTFKKIFVRNHHCFETDVYDLETDNHHFHVGPGDLIVHNTDSTFIHYATDLKTKVNPTNEEKAVLIQDAMNKGNEVEKVVSSLLPWPHNFEYEKTYYPYLLFTKKRYTGILYENDPLNFKYIDKKGTAQVRRDTARILRYAYKNSVNMILFRQDVAMAKKFILDTICEMFENKFDINMFIITKTYKLTKKKESAIVHLARRMTDRDAGNAPQLNDRIQYVYAKIPEREQMGLLEKYKIENLMNGKRISRKKLKQEDQIEEIEYFKKNKLKLDYMLYLTNQLKKPLSEIFSLFVKEKPEWKNFNDKKLFEVKKLEVERELFTKKIKEYELKDKGQMQITSFFKK